MDDLRKHLYESGYAFSNRELAIAAEFFCRGQNRPHPNPHMSNDPLVEAGLKMPDYDPFADAARRSTDFSQNIRAFKVREHSFKGLHVLFGATARIEPSGIYVKPAGDPREIAAALCQEFTIQFRRSLNQDGATYSWESELDGAPLFIEANEVIDNTGTLIPV